MAQDMLLTEEKLRSRNWELFGTRYRNQQDIKTFRMKDDVTGEVNPTVPTVTELEENGETISIGDSWTGRDCYIWIQTTVTIPTEWKHPIGYFDFGLTGSGYNSGFESMIYVDGMPYQSVDTNHKEVFFQKEHQGRELNLTFRLWSGLDGGGEPRNLTHGLAAAFIAELDMDTDNLFYLADTILRTVQVLKDEQLEKHELLHALDKAMLVVDWTDKRSAAYYQTVKEANERLNRAIDGMEKHTRATVSCVGHTHIDTAWRWRLKHTAEKASRSFSTVLRYMEQYPEYIFLHTQPQQYAYIKENFPEIYAQIQERVKEGRWEIDGAMWVEPDCVLTSGESLTRQVLVGRRFMLDEFGKEPEYLWLPDVFGYSYALPQILKKSGINTFMTTKIAWNQYNRMPNDTFKWKGMDGSEVLAHFITNPEPGQDVETNFYSNYNGELYPDVVAGSWKMYREKHINPETLISYGFGDGGGGVTREMLERRRCMDRMPGLPNVKTDTAGNFFRRLQESVANTEEPMATWDGEMYLEYHRGTYTSQAFVKKMNRRMEELYRKAEWLTAMNAVREHDLSKAEQSSLDEGWKMLLTHQFHDILPGSSMREVYDDAEIYYGEMNEIVCGVVNTSLTDMTSDQSGYTILNELAHTRSGMVSLNDFDVEHQVLVDESGMEVAVQKTADGSVAFVEDVPSMGTKYLQVAERKESFAENDCVSVSETEAGYCMESDYYTVVLNEAGQIVSLYDKENDCEVLAEGQRGNVLQFFEDKPLDYDAWDIDMYYWQKMQEVTDLTNRVVVENGPLRMVLRQEWGISKSHICQDMILYKHDRRIDFKTHVDWQEAQKLLKVAFPVDIRTTYATYDMQYGNIKRANNSNSSWERAKFEVVGHRFADLSEHGYGVSLLNDCKYGYDVHQNVMRLTLLKAGIFPDPHADQGEHDFTYAIYPHTNGFVDGNTVKEAADLNQPLVALSGKVSLQAADGSTISLEGAAVELDACKLSEDGTSLVVRFHEYAGAKGIVNVKLGFAVKEAALSDLMERPQEAFAPVENNVIQVKIRPYEVQTLLIRV